MRLHNVLGTIHSANSQTFTGATENLECQEVVVFWNYPKPSMYQSVTEEKLMFFDEQIPELSEIYSLESGIYPSLLDIVEAMNTLIQERNNHRESCVTVKVSRRTRKVAI